ncbi:hypothetical protein jhhlp_005472 [Lomentospora prolificans]|uniref:Uncharacterized protein n=1 Tax=Lomentospora prolificans TaxID=41688 RepID=A0A2N3N6Y8_9PEZI|nr:hypothetical protein jhhlp_005472 [Lomentospora prolificans]
MCVSAAEALIAIFEDIVQQDLVPSLVLMDFFFALHVVKALLAASITLRDDALLSPGDRLFGCPKHLLSETLLEPQQSSDSLKTEIRERQGRSLVAIQSCSLSFHYFILGKADGIDCSELNWGILGDMELFNIPMEGNFINEPMHTSGPSTE